MTIKAVLFQVLPLLKCSCFTGLVWDLLSQKLAKGINKKEEEEEEGISLQVYSND